MAGSVDEENEQLHELWDKRKGDCGQWMNYSRKLWIM